MGYSYFPNQKYHTTPNVNPGSERIKKENHGMSLG
jgi:hypothetical protein